MDIMVVFLFILPQIYGNCKRYSEFIRDFGQKIPLCTIHMQSGQEIISF